MNTPVQTTTRQRWLELIAQYPEEMAVEHRRKHRRRQPALGTLELAFQRDNRPVKRTGKLLNASPTGVLVKQQEWIADHTLVLMRLLYDDAVIRLLGRVAHCTQTVGGYKVGIELEFAD